jgi:nucleoid DNA-binding protein
MANEKLTWLELRKAVAEYANTSEQEAEQFLDALLDGIVEGLKTDKQVKIKGLGNFSLKAVAPRKSVNIATGEAYTIEGYNKLVFNAEAMLKESVEKRIEQSKTEVVVAELNNDPIKKLGEQANEIVDLLADLGQAPNTVEITEVQEVSTIPETKEVQTIPEVQEIPEEPTTPH